MKENTYYLFDNGKKIAFSGSFERLLNKTTKTENAEIYYNNVLVWKQNPQRGVNMVYSDIKKFGFLGIISKKKRYGTEKDKRIVREAILNNKEFMQYAMQKKEVSYINEILGSLINFIIECNEAFYN